MMKLQEDKTTKTTQISQANISSGDQNSVQVSAYPIKVWIMKLFLDNSGIFYVLKAIILSIFVAWLMLERNNL